MSTIHEKTTEPASTGPASTDPASIAPVDHPRTQKALATAKIVLGAYAALSILVLFADVAIAATGHGSDVSSFMWGRAGGVAVSAAVTFWFAVIASRGARWAYRRVRIISIVMPIVIVAVVLIPGAAPLWFKVAQIACAVAVAIAAFVVNVAALRRAFAPRR